MDFLHDAFFDGPHTLPSHMEGSPGARLPENLYFRGQAWPCAGVLPGPFRSGWDHGRSQYDTRYCSWPPHPHRTFDRAQSLDEAYLQHTETANPIHAELYPTPNEKCEYYQLRGYRPYACMSNHRRDTDRRKHHPLFPLDINSGFDPFGCNDTRQRACGNLHQAMPNYTVEEPDENELPAFSQLPHGAKPRRSSPGIHVDPSPGLVNPSSFVVAETEDVSCAWTVSPVSTSRSPRQESPTPAVPPSSPQPGLIHGDHTDMVGAQEEPPFTTPSRRPSSPRSPYQEEFPPRDDTHQAPHREAGDLGTIYHHILRQNEKLKRKREYLHRLRFRLCRKEEELGIWESQLEERETRVGQTESGCYRYGASAG